MISARLCGLTEDEIFDLISKEGFTRSHARSISISIYKRTLRDISGFPNCPKKLREHLIRISNPGIFKPVSQVRSSDGSVKYLFRNEEGTEYETVFLPDGKRKTVCVSTQSGCRMHCPFCATGRMGYTGDLQAGEIVNQVISLPVESRITHVVLMGMGEPMDNLDNVLKACRIITSEWGLAISPLHVTVSTVGITPGIRRFLEESDCNLTVSLYSPFSEERRKVIPCESKYPVREIINLMKEYPVQKKRRMSIGYVMIEGINDSGNHLTELKKLLIGSRIRVNLIPYHAIPGDKNVSSSPVRMQHFKHELNTSGISASIRRSRGLDISAACGLLASGLTSLSSG